MTCTYDIRRGDWVYAAGDNYRVTRYDADNESIVCTDGARTRIFSLLSVVNGDVKVRRQQRSPMEMINGR